MLLEETRIVGLKSGDVAPPLVVVAARPQTVVEKKDIAVGAVGALLSHPPKNPIRAKFSEVSHRWDFRDVRKETG
jgi:hypothetical protein